MSLIRDTFVVTIILLALGGVSLILVTMMDEVNTAFQGADINQSGKDVVQQADTAIPGSMDWIFAMIFIGFPIISLGLANLQEVPPTFFWISILVIIMVTVVGLFVQDMWTPTANSPGLISAASELPITNLIMTNYVLYAMIILFFVGAGTYIKINKTREVL